jgi:hypothetical protein
MTASKIRHEIQQLLTVLIQAELAIITRPVIIQDLGKGIQRVTWSTGKSNTGLFTADFATLDDYLGWIEAEAYSALLYDGSFLQISYDFLDEDVIGHRLAFYPCPLKVDESLLRELPVLDVLETPLEDLRSNIQLRTPIRFDFAPDAAADEHPSSHMTLNSAECRWAVASALSPGHFVRFVFRHFYGHLWPQVPELRSWPLGSPDRVITATDSSVLHVSHSQVTS